MWLFEGRLKIRSRRITGVLVVVAVCAVGSTAAAAATPVVVNVTAGKPSEYAFTVSPKSVLHGPVLFKVVNDGKHAHGFSIDGRSTKVIRPHATTTLTVVFKHKGRYVYQCVTTAAPSDFGPGYNDVPSQCGGGILNVR